jgi:hypothetical protein
MDCWETLGTVLTRLLAEVGEKEAGEPEYPPAKVREECPTGQVFAEGTSREAQDHCALSSAGAGKTSGRRT